jgi:hypothetical protein
LTQIAEILPGVLHWKAPHPKNRFIVHSYYVEDAATVLDPTAPEDVIDELRRRRRPERVVLTNRHHYRQSDRVAEEFDCPVLCPASGLHEFEDGPTVEGYAYGAEVAPGITAHEVGSICPDDAALHIESGPGALALADAVIRSEGQLAFVPDSLMGGDPEGVKRGIVESLKRLLELEFDSLLLAHGEPIVGGGKRALQEFVLASPRSPSS